MFLFHLAALFGTHTVRSWKNHITALFRKYAYVGKDWPEDTRAQGHSVIVSLSSHTVHSTADSLLFPYYTCPGTGRAAQGLGYL